MTKAGLERIGRTVTVERAVRSCLGKRRYGSRNDARDSAARHRGRPGFNELKPYRCTLCGGFHLASVKPKEK